MTARAEIVQMFHPVKERWLQVSLRTGCILRTKKTPGPYAGITIREMTKGATQ